MISSSESDASGSPHDGQNRQDWRYLLDVSSSAKLTDKKHSKKPVVESVAARERVRFEELTHKTLRDQLGQTLPHQMLSVLKKINPQPGNAAVERDDPVNEPSRETENLELQDCVSHKEDKNVSDLI